MKLPRRKFFRFAVGAAALPAMSRIARGQAYPTRPVRFIVPYPPGGATDAAARVVGEFLSRSLGQQIVVENKSGGGSLIGVESAAASAPDGYTVLVTTDIVTSAPHTFKMRIDPLKALTPVVQLSRQPVVLAVHPSLGISTLAEFVALAKQQPGMSFATSGIGTQQQRSHRRPCEDRLARIDAAHPASPGRDPEAAGAIDNGARADPAGRPDLRGAGFQRAGARAVDRRVLADGNPRCDRNSAQLRSQ